MNLRDLVTASRRSGVNETQFLEKRYHDIRLVEIKSTDPSIQSNAILKLCYASIKSHIHTLSSSNFNHSYVVTHDGLSNGMGVLSNYTAYELLSLRVQANCISGGPPILSRKDGRPHAVH